MRKGYMEKIRKFASKTPYFTVHDVKRILGKESYAYLVLNILTKREEVYRLAKGFYSKHDDPSLIVYYFKPAYIGLQDAMSYHNLWEQETATVVITARPVRSGIRKVLGCNVVVKRIDARYFFGFDFIKVGEFYLPISTIEKTFVDLIYFGEWRKDYEKYFKGKVDGGLLKAYANRYPSKIKEKILKIAKRIE